MTASMNPVMKVSDRLGKSEAKAGTLVRAARIETPEPLHRFLAPIERNSRSPVRDLDPDALFAGLDPDIYLAPIRPVTDRVLKEIAECLGEELAVTEQRNRPGGALEPQRRAGLVGEWVVHFRELGGEFADIEPGELVAAGEGFRAADLEHRGENSDQCIGVFDDAAEEFLLF